MSTEFCFLLRHAQEAAELYQSNGKLIEFGLISGLTHEDWKDFSVNKSKIWFRDYARICNNLL
jgi:hypothetical protein